MSQSLNNSFNSSKINYKLKKIKVLVEEKYEGETVKFLEEVIPQNFNIEKNKKTLIYVMDKDFFEKDDGDICHPFNTNESIHRSHCD